MNRLLPPSTALARFARRFVRKPSQPASGLWLTLERLSGKAFQPQIKTHRLTGGLANSWARSVGNDFRVRSPFVKPTGRAANWLKSDCPHDEVY